MNKIILYILFLITAAISSCKKIINKSMLLSRNCTGTYLQYENKYYKVCNIERVAEFKTNSKVFITFKKIESCNNQHTETDGCAIEHEFDSWVQVLEVAQ